MLMLFDRDESFISSLKYNNIRRHREINGLDTLEFETNREVEFGQRLLFKDKQGLWHEYIIIDYFKTHDENGVTYEVFCEDSTSELYGFFIEDMKPRNALASKVLGQILEGTRFEVGYVDDFGKESFNIYRTSVKSALWKILEKYHAEIKVRLVVGKQGIEHRYIDLRQSIGRNVGKTFTYKKDIGSIKKTTSEEVQDSEIVLGNFIKDLSDNMVAYEQLKSIFENDRNRFNDELEKLANGVKSSYIQSILEKFNKELNETGGWVYAEEGEGLLILNAPREGNPTQAINLKGGMIAIANHKNADGSFAYETFGDGNGFTANLIRAGVLRGGKVFFNLEDGTFLIGESRTNYSMYWDGTTLHLRDLDIDLSNNYQIQEINNELTNVDEKIQGARTSFDKGIQDLKKNVDKSIKRIDDDISSVDTKIDENTQGLEESLSGVSSKVDDSVKAFGIKFEAVDKKIDVVSQDFKLGQGKLESTINSKISGLADIVEGNQDDFNSYKLSNAKIIGDIRSEIKQTESSIETSIASQIKTVNNRIDSKDSAIRDYVKSNYSTINQTDEKIKSTVASEVKTINNDLLKNYDTKAEVDAKIKGADTSLKSYISTNYSTISQTDSKIASKVATEIKTVNNKIDSKDSALRTYVSNNYSTKTQTSNLIESKVSSVTSDVTSLRSRVSTAESKISQTSSQISSKISSSDARSIFKQEARSFTFSASQVNFNSNVDVNGTFKTTGSTYWNGSYKSVKTIMKDGSIKFYDGSGFMNGVIFGASGLSIGSNSSVTIDCTSAVNIWSNRIHLQGATKITNGRLTCDNVDAYMIDAKHISVGQQKIGHVTAATDYSRIWFRSGNNSRSFVIDFSDERTYFSN